MSLFKPMKDNLQASPAPQNKRILTPKKKNNKQNKLTGTLIINQEQARMTEPSKKPTLDQRKQYDEIKNKRVK